MEFFRAISIFRENHIRQQNAINSFPKYFLKVFFKQNLPVMKKVMLRMKL